MSPLTWQDLTDSERHILCALIRSARPRDVSSIFLASRVGEVRLNPDTREVTLRALRVLAERGLVTIEYPAKGGEPCTVHTQKGLRLWRGDVVEPGPAIGTNQGLPFLEEVAS